MNLYLCNYNNYYNRIFKRSDNISDYLSNDYDTRANTVFITEDNVNATYVINMANKDMHRFNYLIAQDTDGSFTRWFITRSTYIKKNQYTLTLRRDLISDKWDELSNAIIKINRGHCKPSSPYFFNDEPIHTSSIPKKQTYIKDNSGVSWLVAYLPKVQYAQNDSGSWLPVEPSKTDSPNAWMNKTIYFNTSDVLADYSFAKEEDLAYTIKNGINVIGGSTASDDYFLYYFIKTSDNTLYYVGLDLRYNVFKLINNSPQQTTAYLKTSASSVNLTQEQMQTINYSIVNGMGSNYIDSNTYRSIYTKYNNKIIRLDNGNYYNLKIYLGESNTSNINFNYTNTVTQTIKAQYADGELINQPTSYLTYTQAQIKYELTELKQDTGKFLYSSLRENTNNAQYDCIAVPYKDENGNGYTFNGTYINPSVSMNFMSTLSSIYGTSVVYDVQIIPYQPSINYQKKDYDYTPIYDVHNDSNIIGYVFYVTDINREFNINMQIDATSDKVDFIANHYTLNSPNYNNQYELNVYENNGIDYFNINMTLLPYNPWIKINPNFKYLNGEDFNDSRGLILSGNFSISQLTNEFAEYQYNNINYDTQFNAQMKYTEYLQKQQIISGSISSLTSAIGTGLRSGTQASLIGGPAGIGVGIGVGLLSAGAGVVDNITQYKMNKKANAYTKELYDLNLGNIKSKPTTLSKITAINLNTKMFPYIELSTCTDVEREQITLYFKYNGYNINAVGKINDYLADDYYFSGSVIKLDTNTINNYELVELNNELEIGFYMSKEV